MSRALVNYGADEKMKGQWIGTYAGSSNGNIIVNIDERESNYEGVAFVNESDAGRPRSAAFFSTPNKNATSTFRTSSIQPTDSVTGFFTRWEDIKARYPSDMTFSQYADVTASVEADSLKLSWVTDLGVTGDCVLPRSKAGEPSELDAIQSDWGSYKRLVADMKGRRLLFRGQNKLWRLRTSFHRTGRADLSRFLREDIPALHRHLSARMRHVFNLQNPDENGAFFNLVQHHGYPTPLLDWTYSPYVAAFFAYRRITNEKAALAGPDEKVRIHVFDQERWKRDFNQLLMVVAPVPHVSIAEFIAIENERLIPQQAATLLTSVDDIESYIKSMESADKDYLRAIDLPVRERKQVISELSRMGITAGSLFPGLDGACEELTERNFQI